MKNRRFIVFGLILAIGSPLGYLGVQLFRKYLNVSLVFYPPAEILFLETNSTKTEPLPLLPDNQINNIILFIGDGMGLSHLTATRLHLVGAEGRLNIERLPVTGLVATHAVDNLITDSAASATALASGVKTTNKSIGMDASGRSHPTILEAARDAGLATGLVTTTHLTDATPAAFAAHVPTRAMKSEIAVQLLQSKVNVLFGEGEYFYPRTDPRSQRKDDVNPLAIAEELGYVVVDNRENLKKVHSNFILGLFEDLTTDRKKPQLTSSFNPPTLAELTAKALEVLSSNEKGFFLMVEGEGVDMGSHVNRVDYFIHHLRGLDEAVKVAIDFALQDEHTLVMVAADHETGGLNIIGGAYEDQQLKLNWNTDDHTGAPAPLFAFGPHAVRFTGLKDNTEIPKIMAELLALETFRNQLNANGSSN
jgi:alkaline phosphatase